MQAVYPGEMISFSCRAEGFSMLSYNWFMVASGSNTGMEIQNATDPIYNISNPMYPQDNTGYYCVATNNEGIAVSNTTILTGKFSRGCWFLCSVWAFRNTFWFLFFLVKVL